MNPNTLRKYLMSKIDCAQREIEINQMLVKQLDAETEVGTTAETKIQKVEPEVETKKVKKAEKKTEAVVAETESDDLFGDGEAEKSDEPTTEDVRKVVKDFATKHGKEKALKLLGKFKVTNIPDLKKADYSKIIELAKKHM